LSDTRPKFPWLVTIRQESGHIGGSGVMRQPADVWSNEAKLTCGRIAILLKHYRRQRPLLPTAIVKPIKMQRGPWVPLHNERHWYLRTELR
jgi:hypothetical protein